jgi:hypothetical protein
MVTGAERAILEFAKSLILRYTLFEDPLPNVVALTGQVHKVWDAAVARVADTEYVAPTKECVNLLSGLGWGLRDAECSTNIERYGKNTRAYDRNSYTM